jgi:hypothetical protein
LPAWEIKIIPTAAITRNVSSIVRIIARILFTLNFTRKLTRGCNTIAIIIAKTIGTMMLLAIYIIANTAIRPRRKIVTFA